MRKRVIFAILFALFVSSLTMASELKINLASPQGVIEDFSKFTSIQVVFSEDIIDPFANEGTKVEWLRNYISINPPLDYEIYFSSSTLLKIVPKGIDKLPPSSSVEVKIKKGLKSRNGATLKDDFVFNFMIPPLRITSSLAVKIEDRADSPYLIGIIFDRDVLNLPLEKCIEISTTLEPLPIAYTECLNLTKDFTPPNPNWYSEYLKKKNYIESGATIKCVPFVIADNTDKSVSEFVKKRLKYNYGYSEDKCIILKIATPLPIQSRIIVEFKGECSKFFQIYKTIIEKANPDKALFFSGIDWMCYKKIELSKENDLTFSKPVKLEGLEGKIKIFDAETNEEVPLKISKTLKGTSPNISFDSLGFELQPFKKYVVSVDKDVESYDGEKLGYTGYALFEVTLSRAYISFGEGEGVWESKRGSVVPFYAKNVSEIRQKITKLGKEEIIPLLTQFDDYNYRSSKIEGGYERELQGAKPEKKYNYGLQLRDYLNKNGKGVVFAEVELLSTLGNAPSYGGYYGEPKKSIIQVTDLGITLKYSPTDCLVYVTSLSSASPVSKCKIEVRDFQNKVIYEGVTNEEGICKIEKSLFTMSDEYSSYYTKEFVVFGEKEDDFAYIINNWTEGLEPWQFGIPYNYNISQTSNLKGIIFTDRGVYKLGEEVKFKVILRKIVGGDYTLFEKGTKIEVALKDSKGKVKFKKEFETSSFSSFDGSFVVEKGWQLGNYSIVLQSGKESIYGSFLVASYRKPDFKVNLELEEKEGKIEGKIEGNYLFGAPIDEGEVKYLFEERENYSLPKNISQKYKRWRFSRSYLERDNEREYFNKNEGEGKLDKNGRFTFSYDIKKVAFTKEIFAEAEVKDITRQTISASKTLNIYPDYFVGIYYGEWSFKNFKDGLQTKVILLDSQGSVVPNKELTVELYKVVYKSSRYMTGDYYYDWDSTMELEKVETKKITTGENENDISFELKEGGHYLVKAIYQDGGITYASGEDWYFYGEGYTPWRVESSNKIELHLDKESYNVGDTAKIFVESPWQECEMLITKERENIRSYRLKKVKSTQEIVEIPIEESDIPNMFVSIVLLKGRASENEQDKPQIKLGYANIKVENKVKKLDISITTDKDEYKPKDTIRVGVKVKDFKDNFVENAEVTLWAVDVGVLNLTNYKTPDPMSSFYSERYLSVFNADSREKLISARVNEPKGDDEGGGGGVEFGGVDQIRKDFRVLAFYVGSAITDKNGYYEGEFNLPETLSTFRIMAVAHTKDNLFGKGEKEFLISKNLFVNPYFPRFLTKGDRTFSGVLINSRVDVGGKVKIKAESLTPDILKIDNGEGEFEIKPKGKLEYKFNITALSVGKAKIRVYISGIDESDAFEIVIPVNFPQKFDISSKSSRCDGKDSFDLTLPTDVLKEIGEMKVDVSKSIISELSNLYEFVITYPYGCAEQRSSILYTLLNNYKFAKQVGKLEDKGKEARGVLIKGINDLEPFQRYDGGFGVWKNDYHSYPYLSAYIANLLTEAKKEGLLEDEEMLKNVLKYLKDYSGKVSFDNKNKYENLEALSLSAKVLTQHNDNADHIISRLSSNLSILPTVSLCHLWDATAKSKKRDISEKIEKMLKERIVLTGDEAYANTGNYDNFFFSYWYSKEISTSALLNSFLLNSKDDNNESIEALCKYLINTVRTVKWINYNTHSSSYIYSALSEYARRENKDDLPMNIICKIEGKKVFEEELNKKDSFQFQKIIPISELLKYNKDKVSFEIKCAEGKPFHYTVSLKSYKNKIDNIKEENGFSVERKYFDFKTKEEKTTFKAGDLIEVKLAIKADENKFNVVVLDPLPAGFEILDSAFATTAKRINLQKNENRDGDSDYEEDDWDYEYWYYSGFNNIEKYDDKVLLFGDYIKKGTTTFSYLVRATSQGEFTSAGTRCSEMYNEEVYGSAPSCKITVEK